MAGAELELERRRSSARWTRRGGRRGGTVALTAPQPPAPPAPRALAALEQQGQAVERVGAWVRPTGGRGPRRPRSPRASRVGGDGPWPGRARPRGSPRRPAGRGGPPASGPRRGRWPRSPSGRPRGRTPAMGRCSLRVRSSRRSGAAAGRAAPPAPRASGSPGAASTTEGPTSTSSGSFSTVLAPPCSARPRAYRCGDPERERADVGRVRRARLTSAARGEAPARRARWACRRAGARSRRGLAWLNPSGFFHRVPATRHAHLEVSGWRWGAGGGAPRRPRGAGGHPSRLLRAPPDRRSSGRLPPTRVRHFSSPKKSVSLRLESRAHGGRLT